jgi:hypothetical protein
MTGSGSGCPLNPRATAVIAGVLAGRGGLLPERARDDGAGDGHGCVPVGASTMTTLTMVSAVCGVTMLADLRHAPGWLPLRRLTGSGNWPLSRATGPAKMLSITTACFETL